MNKGLKSDKPGVMNHLLWDLYPGNPGVDQQDGDLLYLFFLWIGLSFSVFEGFPYTWYATHMPIKLWGELLLYQFVTNRHVEHNCQASYV